MFPLILYRIDSFGVLDTLQELHITPQNISYNFNRIELLLLFLIKNFIITTKLYSLMFNNHSSLPHIVDVHR